MITQPIAVACPRCTGDIMCTVEARIVPGPHGGSGVADLRITDLADRFAEHYVQAGHSASKGVARRQLGWERKPETFLPADTALADPAKGWLGRVAAGAAGANPELPNA